MTEGGGIRQLAPGLTNADAIAHAVIGAAKALGYDPVTALTTTDKAKNSPGRCVPAAINALALSRADREAVCRILGRNYKTVEGAALRQSSSYAASLDGARRAVEVAQTRARMLWADEVRGILKPEPEPEPAPAVVAVPPPRPDISRSAGPISAFLAPPPVIPAAPPPVGSLSDRLLQALAGGPRNSCSLASELGVKELVVGQCLSALRHEKRVRSDAALGLGRALLWSLSEHEAAA